MIDPKSFPFDLDQMTTFFKANDFTKAFATPQMPNLDADSILDAQKKNMEALVAASKAAAAGYQDLFAKQVQVFEATLAEAQKQISDFDPTKVDAISVAAQGEVAKAVFDKALGDMTALAEGAQKANADALALVSASIQETTNELQEMAKKFTK
ncbi:MAG: TIGR01841 family phasin [Paracoccaceae bacterium]|jgi:phasin family protein